MFLLRPLCRLGFLLLGAVLLFQATHAAAGNVTVVRIVVLAYKGAEAVQEDLSYVRNWLAASIPGHRFILLDFDQAGLTRAVHDRSVDFVITSSGH